MEERARVRGRDAEARRLRVRLPAGRERGARGPRPVHGPGRLPRAAPGAVRVSARRRVPADAARIGAGDGAWHLRPRDPLHAPAHRGDRGRPLPPWCHRLALLPDRAPLPVHARGVRIRRHRAGAAPPDRTRLALSRLERRHRAGHRRRGRAEALRLAAARVARFHRPSPRGRGRRRHRARAGARVVEQRSASQASGATRGCSTSSSRSRARTRTRCSPSSARSGSRRRRRGSV